jgi:hypothetical protein
MARPLLGITRADVTTYCADKSGRGALAVFVRSLCDRLGDLRMSSVKIPISDGTPFLVASSDSVVGH